MNAVYVAVVSGIKGSFSFDTNNLCILFYCCPPFAREFSIEKIRTRSTERAETFVFCAPL